MELFQVDSFFNVPVGRLKLRQFADGAGELIFYQRADQVGPKTSQYSVAPVVQPNLLREVLTQAYGCLGEVRKHRTLYLVGRTRVHLDRVEQLGEFLELEVVLADDEDVGIGETEAQSLMRQFGILPDQTIASAYLDLLRSTK